MFLDQNDLFGSKVDASGDQGFNDENQFFDDETDDHGNFDDPGEPFPAPQPKPSQANPECQGIGYTRAHHTTRAAVMPGRTETGGLINLCNFHHNEHHDGELDIIGDPEQTITFTWTDVRTVTSTAHLN